PRKDVRDMLEEILGISSNGIGSNSSKGGHSCAKTAQKSPADCSEQHEENRKLTEAELSKTLKRRNFNKSTKLEHVLY
ncbi:aspartate aminotransferase, partial [Bifidobacterium sp. UMB1197]|nr:aspartate aminotransferase [Bifidobacterium sp. UMB1197]